MNMINSLLVALNLECVFARQAMLCGGITSAAPVSPTACPPPQVYNTPSSHVTRDWQERTGQLGDLNFKVMDTSGMEPSLEQDSIQVHGVLCGIKV